jgi:ferritin
MNTIMISEKLQNAINEQISAEMWSSNLYLSMSFYFEREGFSGFAHWMKKQSQEEMGHAYAMADYIIKRGGIAKVDKIDVVPTVGVLLLKCLSTSLSTNAMFLNW